MNATAIRRDHALRVVIVDDTEDIRLLLNLALSRGGMEVVGEAGDGRAALEVVAREQPDVVLLDLMMPVMDGVTALPRIRRLVPSATVIILSGYGADQGADRVVGLGADGYLQKGLAIREIVTFVEDIASDPPPRPLPTLRVVAPHPN